MKGPYRIINVLSKLNIVLGIKKKNVTVHVNRVKPFIEMTELKDDENEFENIEDEEDIMIVQN